MDMNPNVSDDLLAFRQHLLHVTDRDPVVMARGERMYLWDTSGTRYLDFLGGWAVNALGHSPKIIHDALCEQAGRLVNASPTFYNTPMLELAHLLTETSCLDRVFFCSTGAEANESAIKLARKYGAVSKDGAYQIITTEKGFHGRTLATMAATGKAAWRGLFEPEMEGFVHVPFDDVGAVERAISKETVAFMVEPIQGEGGVNVPSPSYLKEVRELCDRHGILLILDEVQTGIGRTGTMFAYEQAGIEPDIMTLGKGLGGGFPVAAMLAKEHLNIFETAEQGGTFTGQPLAMAVALAVVSHIREEHLCENARAMGEEIRRVLAELARDFPIHSIRGTGLLIGFDLGKPLAQAVKSACFTRGLILNTPGPQSVRLVPPLIVSTEHIAEMAEILRAALSDTF